MKKTWVTPGEVVCLMGLAGFFGSALFSVDSSMNHYLFFGGLLLTALGIVIDLVAPPWIPSIPDERKVGEREDESRKAVLECCFLLGGIAVCGYFFNTRAIAYFFMAYVALRRVWERRKENSIKEDQPFV